ncbi:preprotein translocase subunit TatA [Brevibacillus agri]|uniref:preprotein translocase subunit TatA n=1 Tax=Brevibacillus agri TaxID=51101 RepID=UPI003D19B42A
MLHPVKECIAKTGLTHNAFAVLHGISLQRLKDCLYGYTASIPKRIISVMIQNGYDEQEAQKQYLQWRRWKAEQELLSFSHAKLEGRRQE